MKNVKIWFSVVALLLSIAIPANAGDTLKINITYKHSLSNEGLTTGYKVVKQQFLTPEGVFFREINYSDVTGMITDYTYRFFKNNLLFTEERYNSADSLMYIIKHDYDSRGNEIATTRLLPDGNGFKETEKMLKSYSSGNRLVSTKTFYGKQLVSVTTCKYNPTGLLISEKTSSRPAANDNNLKLYKAYSYTGNGNISSIELSGTSKDGKTFKNKEKYEYDEKGFLTSIKLLNEAGVLLSEKAYKYYKYGALNIYEEHDSAGKMTLMLQYEYRKHYMEKGTQVSRYENP